MYFVIKHRIIIIITGILLAVFFGLFLHKLKKSAGIDSLIDRSTEHYRYYKETEKTFGKMETITIGISSEKTVFDKEVLKAIGELSDFFKNREEIEENDVLSLTTVDNMIGRDKELIVEPLVENYNDLSNEDLINIKKQVNENPLLNNRLVSKDEKSTLIIAGIITTITVVEEKFSKIINATYDKVDELKKTYQNVNFYVSGYSTSEGRITKFMTKDLIRLTPIALLVVMLILLFVLKELRTMILPIIVTVFSIIWTLSLKALLNTPLTISEIVIPVMLISICCAYGIHIIHEFFLYLQKNNEPKEAILKTMKILTIPTVLSALTTAIGFLSLISAPGISIRNMGLFLGFGVIVAMFYSLFFIPAILSFYKLKKTKKEHFEKIKNIKNKFKSNFFDFLSFIVIKYKYLIMIITFVLIVLVVISFFNIKYDTDPVSYFHKNDDFRLGTEHINKTMGGISDLYVVFDSEEENIIKDPKILKTMWELQKYTEKLDNVSFTFSITDYVRHINYVINDQNEIFRKIPDIKETIDVEKYSYINGKEIIKYEKKEVSGKEQVANLLLLYELGGGDVLTSIVNQNYSKACIHVIIRDTSTNALRILIKQLDQYIDKNIKLDNINIRYTNHYIRMIMTDNIVKSQINSLLTTLIAISILLIIIYRSFMYGLITLLPTFIAIMCNFIAMWIFNVPLDVGTSVIASIGIGVGIDYAVHLRQRFKLNYLKYENYKIAVKNAINESGPGILSNAFAVGVGFLILTFSSFRIIFDIGWIITLSMFTTSFSALLVLPSFILIVKPKIKK
ncbi:MAG: MMPL family transporter [Spirochaetes bacterium]|nr:MMPL family transporter [Spirochaetota bacterium]